jgi:hypothetical protein
MHTDAAIDTPDLLIVFAWSSRDEPRCHTPVPDPTEDDDEEEDDDRGSSGGNIDPDEEEGDFDDDEDDEDETLWSRGGSR